jgi:hypothetical protein
MSVVEAVRGSLSQPILWHHLDRRHRQRLNGARLVQSGGVGQSSGIAGVEVGVETRGTLRGNHECYPEEGMGGEEGGAEGAKEGETKRHDGVLTAICDGRAH